MLYFFLLFYFHFYFLLDSFYCRNFTNCWYFNNLDIFLGVPCKESLWTRVLYSAFIYEREVLPKKSSHHLEWAMLLSVSILRSQIHTELAQFAWLVRITELIFSIICKTQKKKIKQALKKQIKMLMWECTCHTNTCDGLWVWNLLFHSNPWSALALCIKCSFCMHG